MMSEDETPWTTDQMRQNSTKWTLEGDAKLLLYLKAFSKDLHERAKSTKSKIDSMISTLDYTQVALGNSTNRFHALQHSQFVESRVYEEDISEMAQKVEEPIKEKVKMDPAVIAKQAVLAGIKLMETHYEKIPIDNSGDSIRYKLQLKDQYHDRPLPPRFGSKEFVASLTVSESSSEGGHESSRSRSPSNTSSQSKSLSHSPIIGNNVSVKSDSVTSGVRTQHYQDGSVRSQPDLFGQSSDEDDDIFANRSQKYLDTTSNKSTNSYGKNSPQRVLPTNTGLFGERDDIFGGIPPKAKPRENYPILFNDGPPLLDDIFDKDVVNTEKSSLFDDEETGTNKFGDGKSDVKQNSDKNTVFKNQTIVKPKVVNLFDEEPPEIDSFASGKLGNSSASSSTGKNMNLFDDSDEDGDLFANIVAKPVNKKEVKVNVFSDEPPEIDQSKGAIKKSTQINKTPKTIDLFNDSDEEDLFASLKTKTKMDASNRSLKTDTGGKSKINLFDDEDDDIIIDTKPKIEPKIKNEVRNKINQKSNRTKTNVSEKPKANNETDDIKIVPKTPIDSKNNTLSTNVNENSKISLFDDDEDIKIESNMFSKNSTSKQMSFNLFDDEPPLDFGDDLPKTKIVNKSTDKKLSLFSDSDDEDIFANLIKNEVPKKNVQKVSQSSSSKIDDKIDKENKSQNIVNSSDETKEKIGEDMSKSTNKSLSQKISSSQKLMNENDLFDDEDDLFSTIVDVKKNGQVQKSPVKPSVNVQKPSNKVEHSNENKIVREINIPETEKSENESNMTDVKSVVKTVKSSNNYSVIVDKSIVVKNNTSDISDKPTVILDKIKDKFDKSSVNIEKPSIKSNISSSPENVFHENNDSNKTIVEKQKSVESEKSSNDAKTTIVKNAKSNTSEKPTQNLSRLKPSPKVQSKIVGVFEDPIFRDTEDTIDKSESPQKGEGDVFSNDNHENVEIKRKKSVYEEAATNIALFADEPPIDIFEDLKISKKNDKRISLFDDDEPDFFNDISKNENSIENNIGIGLFDNEPPVDIDFNKTNKSDRLFYDSDEDLFNSKSNSVTKKPIEQNSRIITPSKTNEPKKLTRNLNINVSALLPGARPPKKHDLENVESKSVVSNSDKKLDSAVASGRKLDNVILERKLDNVGDSDILSRQVNAISDRNGGFVEHTETLHNSAVKDRPKIRTKRRPQTRKARQEAVRKSLILENETSDTVDTDNIMEDNESSENNSLVENKIDLTPETDLSGILNGDRFLPIVQTLNDDDYNVLKSNIQSRDHDLSSTTTSLKDDILSPSTEEDDIFKIEKLADDDTLKFDCNNIFNDSDNSDIKDLDDSDSDSPSKRNDIKSKKEFNLIEALTNQTERPKMYFDDSIQEILSDKNDERNSMFNPLERESSSDMSLKLVPENLDITKISTSNSDVEILDGTDFGSDILKNTIEEVFTSSVKIQDEDKKSDDGKRYENISVYSEVADKLSTLAIDGSAEVIHSAKVGKTSKDMLFDSDLEEDLFTAKPLPLRKSSQNVTHRGDAATDNQDSDLFDGSQKTSTNTHKTKTGNLFSDTEDDEDLFKVVTKISTKNERSKKATPNTATSLFGDSDDDDDLFKTNKIS